MRQFQTQNGVHYFRETIDASIKILFYYEWRNGEALLKDIQMNVREDKGLNNANGQNMYDKRYICELSHGKSHQKTIGIH